MGNREVQHVSLTVPIVLGLDPAYQGYALMLAPNGPVSDVSFQVATEDDAVHLAAHPEQWVKVAGTIYYERQPHADEHDPAD